MPRYTTNYSLHGLTYSEIERHNNISLFEGVAPTGRKEYEIHVLRLKPALMKVLYLSIERASKKWTMPIHNWGPALARFAIEFGARMPDLSRINL